MTPFDLITTKKWIWLVDYSSLLLSETMRCCHFHGIKNLPLSFFLEIFGTKLFLWERSVFHRRPNQDHTYSKSRFAMVIDRVMMDSLQQLLAEFSDGLLGIASKSNTLKTFLSIPPKHRLHLVQPDKQFPFVS